MKLFVARGVVGSREFANYQQMSDVLDSVMSGDDIIVSGGAVSDTKCKLCNAPVKWRSADFMAQRYAKEKGWDILIRYPKYHRHGRGATFVRNKTIVESSDEVHAFYQKGRFQQGGTANTIEWCRKLGVPYFEYEEEN